MDWYWPIACAALVAQLLVVYYAVNNYHYAATKLRKKKPSSYRPRTALIIPCKGIDGHFASNIRSFFEQDYESCHLLFVVEDESDPAYQELHTLVQEERKKGLPNAEGAPTGGLLPVGTQVGVWGPKGRAYQILVAGGSRSCSQKIHNLLYAVDRVPPQTEVLAFADSDICVHRDWLGRLVHPLCVPKRGVTTGYRWFIPTTNNAATLAASALNAAVAQCLGNTHWNLAWGGSMAIRAEDFRRLGMREIWSQALSDDLSLSWAVRRAGLRIVFVPACLVASFESFTWRRLCEFGRRQFLITRVYAPLRWWMGFLSSLGSVLGLWGGAAAALYAGAVHAEHIVLYAAVPIVFFTGQLTRAVLRQLAMAKAVGANDYSPGTNDYSPLLARLLPAAVADVFGCWLWSLLLLALLLSSAAGRTIRWRGIRYRLVSPTHIHILNNGSGPQVRNPALGSPSQTP
jgi:cellulose synthase/poly-beta-1,6-N-acetylglucosamine synthase-like glycosyltransferase